jgi:hypothetical protein
MGDIEEDCRAQMLPFQASGDPMDNSMHFVDGRMASSKAKLIVGKECRKMEILSKLSNRSFSKTFEGIGRRLMGR